VNAEDLRRRLDAIVGRESPPQPARDAVNLPMIRHWCDAVGDRNPVYTDPDFAARSRHGGLVAPPAMLQAWIMPGLIPAGRARLSGVVREVLELLDEAGFTSVVATNCRQQYRRYLRPGERVQVTTTIERVSEEKRTALGPGHFVDQRMIYRSEDGDEVASMQFRMLKFRPPGRPARAGGPGAARRPRPGRTQDSAFFWEGVDQGRLLIQRCRGCGRLQHPPGPMCGACHGLEWEAAEMSGLGRVYSFVVAHHPPIPPFEYPNAIALVELAEGPRLVSNLVGVDPAVVEIGMPVRVAFTRVDDELVLPLFRPTEEAGGARDG
jgi:3-oxo-4,17-pregnadiene-20-carboxyl-CoA hydratase alpha subunit